MFQFWTILRTNRNYRYLWLGQLIGEAGYHFNSIAVLSLSLHLTGSGAAVGAVMMARTIPAMIAGPIAGVVLDRLDRKQVMIWSDLVRAVFALAFVLVLTHGHEWLLYPLSALLMFASPFFNSGRSAILPTITRPEELHTANALTQTTAWLTLSIGTMIGGVSAMQFGYFWAFVVNALSFLFSAWAVARVQSPAGHFRAERSEVARKQMFAGDLRECWRYIASTPLVLAIALTTVGWASGGGAAQILFTLFGEVVYQRGPAGVGIIWGFAGVGLVVGGVFAHWLGPKLQFAQYKQAISAAFFVHGLAYVCFALMPTLAGATVFITLSRIGMGVNNVLNRTMLLTHVPDHLRGRVYTTVDTLMHTAMLLSLTAASVATLHWPIRTIGVVAGVLSTTTAVVWAWADAAGKLQEPLLVVPEAEDEEGLEPPDTPA